MEQGRDKCDLISEGTNHFLIPEDQSDGDAYEAIPAGVRERFEQLKRQEKPATHIERE